MAQVTGDRVLETTATTGTGTITLAGAVSGYRAFSAVATVDGDTFYYTIALGTEWEVGLGTRASSTTFTRTTIIASSNAGAAVNFSAGTKEVWMDIPARLVQMFTPSINPCLINGKLFESHAGNAVTYAIKTLAGNDPSAADPVFFIIGDRDGTTYNTIVTSALNITVPSGATLGVVNAKCPRIWLAAMYVSGAIELAVMNCHDQAINSFAFFPVSDCRVTTTIINTSSDSALVPYSTTARTSVPFAVLGNFTYDATLATAGTWSVAPAYIVHYSPQMARPGQAVQTQIASSDTNTTALGSSTFTDTTVAVTITPQSFANVIRVRTHGGTVKHTSSGSITEFRLRNTTLGVTVGPAFQGEVQNDNIATTYLAMIGSLIGHDKPCLTTAQTYKLQFYDTAIFGMAVFGNGDFCQIVAEEIQT